METLFAGIDLGTSGVRLAIINADKQLKSNTFIRYDQAQKQSPELWWQSVQQLLFDLPDDLKSHLQSLAIDGTSGTILLTDKQGTPTSRVLMYDDLRATKEADLIKQHLPEDNGGQGASGSLARLLWLLKHDASANHHHAVHQADYILGKLSNNFSLSDENNCLKLGFDVVNMTWNQDAMQSLGIDLSLLPEVFPAGTLVASIHKAQASKLGLPESLQLVTGTTDSIAAFIATGTQQLGEAVTSLGSTLVVKLLADKPIFSVKYGVYSHRLGDQWLVGGASNSGGKVLRHYFSEQEMDAMTSQLSPSKLMGLDYYPLLKEGERFPVSDPQKQAQLSPRPDANIDFFQGMLEGIATIEKQAYQRLHDLGAPIVKSVRSVGGGSKNAAWTKIRQQQLYVEMITPEYSEASYGAALLALKGFITGIKND